MAFLILIIIFLYINNFLLIIISLPVIGAFLANNMPTDGSWDFKILYDGTVISYYYSFCVWLLIFIILNICNLIYLKIKIKDIDIKKIRKYCLIIKILAIPYWVISAALHFSLFFIFYKYYNSEIFYIPFPVIISYIILLSTSSYSILYLNLLKKGDLISFDKYIKNIILQLLFITDLIGVLKITNKNNE
ncbi:MAG: hypothetical protein FWD28_01750 [Treponema sp.]|nr:hypothetical protein [Treponema sp.]